MRLLDVNTYELVDFTLKRPIPEYGILSYTWGEEEVTFADLASPNRHTLKGWTKVENTCRLASKDGYSYVWIDTCCIDKSSSAELSEAINSMFVWYQQSAKCYVALSDVHDYEVGSIMASRWWTRGWTLQELLAPNNLFFYDSNWILIGQKTDYAKEICELTGVPVNILNGEKDLRIVCIVARMSWASKRQMTRLEDEAYCLMGLFDVNMPLIYGEGQRAFERLQYEIIRTTTDLSFLAHDLTGSCNLLARSPRAFIRSRDFRNLHDHTGYSQPESNEMALTNHGLKLQAARFWSSRCDSSDASDTGRHYALRVAISGPDPISVCYQRLGSNVFVRHPSCLTARDSAPSLAETETRAQHADDNVTLLFGGNEDSSTRYPWPVQSRIQLPNAEDLRCREPCVYPSSVFNWEVHGVALPRHSHPNSFYVIVSHASYISPHHDFPMIGIQCSGAYQSCPIEYFLHERRYDDMLTLRKDINALVTDCSIVGLLPKLNKQVRRSRRYRESDGTDTFVTIRFFPHVPRSWYMRLQPITREQHYLLKMKDFWLRSLPQSAKRLQNEPERISRKLHLME